MSSPMLRTSSAVLFAFALTVTSAAITKAEDGIVKVNSGLDWPVRLLVTQEKGDVYTVYTDFDWIAKRHGITDRKEQFDTANKVVASITSSIRAR